MLLPRQESDSLPLPKHSELMATTSSESIQGDSGSLNWEDETLAEPEIPGLWNQGREAHKVPAVLGEVRGVRPDRPSLRGGSAGTRSGLSRWDDS